MMATRTIFLLVENGLGLSIRRAEEANAFRDKVTNGLTNVTKLLPTLTTWSVLK